MNKPSNVRNISVIGHVDSGKTVLTDCLLAKAGITSPSEVGVAHLTNTHSDENEIRVTKSSSVPLYAELNDEDIKDIASQKTDGKDFLINLINVPDFIDSIDPSHEATAALLVIDGALIVVDAMGPIPPYTTTVIYEAIRQRIKPALVINNVHRAFRELVDAPEAREELYRLLARRIEDVNHRISNGSANLDGPIFDGPYFDGHADPGLGLVAFSSGPQGWAFNVRQFASRYAKKFGIDSNKLTRLLWGENYYNPDTKQWTRNGTHDGKKLERSFNQFILDPIFKLFKATRDLKMDEVDRLLVMLDIKLSAKDKAKEGDELFKAVMQAFLPASDCLLEMAILHLPSPLTAQKYRVDTLYRGPKDDEAANGIRECDPKGPLMLYVSLVQPTSDEGRFYAFGRVFSGTIRSGLKVRIQGQKYTPGSKDDLLVKAIERTVLNVSRKLVSINDIPAGNVIGLVDDNNFPLKWATLTTSETASNMDRNEGRKE